MLVLALWLGQRPQKYQTYTVREEKVSYWVKEQGQVVYQPMLQIYAELGGKILTIKKRAGASVSPGEVLAELDVSELQAQQQQLAGELQALAGSRQMLTAAAGGEQARLAYEQARLAYEQARLDWQRRQELEAAGAVPAAEMETYRLRLQQAEKELARARTQWQSAERQLRGQQQSFDGQQQSLLARWQAVQQQIARGQVRTPVGGKILAVQREAGEMVLPGQSLFVVGEPSNWQVEVKVEAELAMMLKPGQQVELSWQHRGTKETFSGRIAEIGLLAEKTLSSLGVEEARVKVKIVPLNKPDIEPLAGSSLEIKFMIKEVKALAVPRELLLHGDDGDYLWVLRQGQAEKVKVKTGLVGNELVEIISGLKPGEEVIINQQ